MNHNHYKYITRLSKFTISTVIITALSVVGCATGQTPASNPANSLSLSIDRTESLRPGRDNEQTAKQILGEPNMKVTDPEPGTGEIWLYFDPGTTATRVSLQFDPQTTLLLAAAWFVRGSSPEEDLKTAIARFPNAHFEKRAAIQVVPDLIPNEAYLVDKKLGVEIEYMQSNNRVHSIMWTTPKTQN